MTLKNHKINFPSSEKIEIARKIENSPGVHIAGRISHIKTLVYFIEKNFDELQTAIRLNTQEFPTSAVHLSSSMLEISRLTHNALSIASSARNQIRNIYGRHYLQKYGKKKQQNTQVVYPELAAIYEQFENDPLFQFTKSLRNIALHVNSTNTQWRTEITDDNTIETFYLIDSNRVRNVTHPERSGKLALSGYNGTFRIDQLFADYKNMLLDYISQVSSCLEEIHKEDLKEYKSLQDQLYESKNTL